MVVTAGALVLATLIRAFCIPLWGSAYTFITYYPAIMFVAVAFGWRHGLIATLVSAALSALLFLHPAAPRHDYAIALSLFIMVNLFIVLLSEAVRRTRLQAQADASLARAEGEALRREIEARAKAEGALSESEDRLRLFIEHAPAAIAMFDREMRYLAVSKRWLTTYHVEAEILGRSHYDVFPEIPERWKAVHRRVLDGAVERTEEDLWERADGTHQWLRWEVRPWYDRDGAIGGIVVFSEDITAQKDAERATHDSEERYRALTDAVPSMTFEGDVLGNNTFASRQWCDYTGMTTEDTAGTGWVKAVHPDDLAGSVRRWAEGMERGLPCEMRHRLRAADGSYRWFLIRAIPRRDSKGNIIQWLGSCTDIDDMIRAEAALLDTEERLRLAVESAEIGTWDLNLMTGENRWDARCKALFGLPADAEVPYELFLARLHPDDRERVRTTIEETIGSPQKGAYDIEYRILLPEGRERWIRAMGRAFFEERGGGPRAVRFTGTALDMTERRLAEERLRSFAQELEGRVRARTQELELSEDRLRALATELNLTEQRERKRLAIELHDHLAQLLIVGHLSLSHARQFAAGRCLELLDQVENVLDDALKYTRTLVADLSPPVLYDLGLPAALTWLSDYMQRYELAVRVILPEGEEVPKLPEAEAVLLFQSVRELLINASKHAETGAASVTVQCRDGELRIEVRDEGKGFNVAEAELADGHPTARFGLFSIRERMRAIGGAFDIQSVPEYGTTAILMIPLRRGPDRELGTEATLLSAPWEERSVGPIQSVLSACLPPGSRLSLRDDRDRIRVLLVDDHEMVREGLRSLLEMYDDVVVVGEASDGRQAVEVVDQVHPNIVVMDINMPTMNGVEATSRIKARHPDTIVIGLSVNAAEENQAAMKKAGAALLFTKEAAVDQLYRTIRQAMSKVESRDDSPVGGLIPDSDSPYFRL